MRMGELLKGCSLLGAFVLLALPGPANAEWSADGTGGAVVVTGDGDDDYVEGNIVLSSFNGIVWNVFNTNGQIHGAMANGCSSRGQDLWYCNDVVSMTFASGGGADDIRISKDPANPVPVSVDLGPGNDAIRGIQSDSATNAIDGGAGRDRWDIQNDSAELWDIDLAAGAADGTLSGPITAENMEDLVVYAGPAPPAAGHSLKGNGDPNTIDAPASNDTIDGRAGADVIFARSGDDVITGGPGNDSIDCGPGTDTVLDEEAGDVLTGCEISGAPPIEVNVASDEVDLDLDDDDCDVDDGETGEQCTLRAALQIANHKAGKDEINFAIDPSGPATIAPQEALPGITEGVEIHGGTQPGTPAGEPGVIIDGADIAVPPQRVGSLFMFNVMSGSGTMLERMGFVNAATALGVQIDASLTEVRGSLIGLTEMFSAGVGSNTVDGIYVEGTDTVIRDSVISGNGRYGVHLAGPSRFTRLINNTIGPLGPPEGLSELGPITNQLAGIAIAGGSQGNVIGGETIAEGNAIGRNGVGVLLDDAGRGNEVISNQIGATHADGPAVELLANEGEGIRVVDTRLDEGDELEITTNTIANNGGDGIRMEDSTGADITGNAIGALMSETDCTHVLIDNELRQVHAEVAEDVERAPGTEAKRFLGGGGVNLGEANGQMLEALGGNLICDENGEAISFTGLLIAEIEANVMFGGAMLKNLEGMFRKNTVSDSDGAGVELGKGTEVELAENIFFENDGRPIELAKGDSQVEPDPLDPDKGPNQLQNYPFLGYFQAAEPSWASRVSLMAAKKGQFRIEFFGADSCAPSGQADVREFIGSKVVESNAAGLVNVIAELPAGSTAHPFVTATATRLDVPNPMTSEIGPCIPTTQGSGAGFGLTPLDLYLKKGKVKTVADCLGAIDCSGEAVITDREGTISYGEAAIDMEAGDSKQIKVEVTKKLEKILKKEKRAEVILESTTDQVRSTPLVLRLKK